MVVGKIFAKTMMEMKRKRWSVNKHKFLKSGYTGLYTNCGNFCCKNVSSNLFFRFQIYLGRHWRLRRHENGDDEEDVNEKDEEDA